MILYPFFPSPINEPRLRRKHKHAIPLVRRGLLDKVEATFEVDTGKTFGEKVFECAFRALPSRKTTKIDIAFPDYCVYFCIESKEFILRC